MYDLHPEQKLSIHLYAIERQEQLREVERQIAESKRDVPATTAPESFRFAPLSGRWAPFGRLRFAIGGVFSHSPRRASTASVTGGGAK